MTEPVFEQAGGPSPSVKAEMDWYRHGRPPVSYVRPINVSTSSHRDWSPVAWMAGLAVLDVLLFPLADSFLGSDLVANADLSGGYLQKLGDTLVGLATVGVGAWFIGSVIVIFFGLAAWISDQ